MIETRKLAKSYGDLTALEALDLKVHEGDVFGLIGPNGAGKTTTMRILATLLPLSSGEAEICGVSLSKDPAAIRRLIGFMPDFIGLYDDMTVTEYLGFFASARRIEPGRRKGLVEDVLALTDLTAKADSLVSALSRGMQQRLGIAQLLLHDPKVLLLDEPASGLDPRGRVEMRGLLQELSKMGKTIVISSHILFELGVLCNRIGIIDQGRLVFSGTVEEAREKALGARALVVEVRERARDAAAVLRACPGVSWTERDGNEITALLERGVQSFTPYSKALVEAGFAVTRFTGDETDLERIFKKLVAASRGEDQDSGSILVTDLEEPLEECGDEEDLLDQRNGAP